MTRLWNSVKRFFGSIDVVDCDSTESLMPAPKQQERPAKSLTQWMDAELYRVGLTYPYVLTRERRDTLTK